MKLLPNVFDDNFDNFFKDPFFRRTSSIMKTDIHEAEDCFLLNMELPGYHKEDINLELKDGYLNVNATQNSDNEEKDKKGNIIRKERYSGSCSRSFFVGNAIREEDIKANFENGELRITFPKETAAKVETKKFIPIE